MRDAEQIEPTVSEESHVYRQPPFSDGETPADARSDARVALPGPSATNHVVLALLFNTEVEGGIFASSRAR